MPDIPYSTLQVSEATIVTYAEMRLRENGFVDQANALMSGSSVQDSKRARQYQELRDLGYLPPFSQSPVRQALRDSVTARINSYIDPIAYEYTLDPRPFFAKPDLQLLDRNAAALFLGNAGGALCKRFCKLDNGRF